MFLQGGFVSIPFNKVWDVQARSQDFMWGGGGGGANEAKVDQTTEMYFFIVWSVYLGK